MYLYGWKEIAKFIGCHPRTVLRWHQEKMKLPSIKVNPHRSGAIIVEIKTLQNWMRQMGRK